MNEISILFTNYKSEELIIKNIYLLKKLNPSFTGSIIIVNNDSESNIDKLITDDTVQIVNNPALNTNTSYLNASYHHAEALNIGLKYVNSKILIVIDADFFAIYPEWIDHIVNSIKENKYLIWGSPYYPSYFTKYRYFPCAHFMAFNLQKININDLDFSPQLESYYLFQKKLNKCFVPKKVQPFFLVGKSKDTGYLIYSIFKNVKYFSLVPVLTINKTLFGKLKYLMSYILPEKFSLYPKSHKSFSINSFLPAHYEVINKKWEEYYCGEKPFALHLRLGGNEFNNENSVRALRQLDEFVDQYSDSINNN